MMPHTIFHLCLPGTDAHQMHGGGDSGGSGDDLSYSELEQPTAEVERKGEDVGPLVCVGIDDEESARSVQLMIFSSYMKADMRRSCVLGATREEQVAFVDIALGLRGVQLERMPSGQQADLALLDDNIDCNGQEHLKGRDVARTLRERGFHGVIGIMSASSIQRLTELRETDGIDLVFSKNTPPIVVTNRVRCALAARRSMAGRGSFMNQEALAASSMGLPLVDKSGGLGEVARPHSLSFGKEAQLQGTARVGVREVIPAGLGSLARHQTNVITGEMKTKESGPEEEDLEEKQLKEVYGIGGGGAAAVELEDLITMVPTKVADLRMALADMGNSHSLLIKIVRHVCELSTAHMVAALDAGDLPAVRRQAHKLGGTVSYVRAHSLLAACHKLQAFTGEDEGVGHELVQTLSDQLETLKASFALLKPESGIVEPARARMSTGQEREGVGTGRRHHTARRRHMIDHRDRSGGVDTERGDLLLGA